jgi:hypothetical protein
LIKRLAGQRENAGMYMLSNEDDPTPQVESTASKENKASKAGLIGGIGSVLLLPPLAYLETGLIYNLFRAISWDYCSLPVCFLPIGVAVAIMVRSVRTNKFSGRQTATVGLVFYILTTLLVTAAVILGFIHAIRPA